MRRRGGVVGHGEHGCREQEREEPADGAGQAGPPLGPDEAGTQWQTYGVVSRYRKTTYM
jgi:hypothetical protein